ncbi:hypothetical protein N2152v2_003007 [Parachlorella kessleri]
MQITVRPRVQKDLWSLYWKESMETKTKTELLEDLTMDVQANATAAEVLKTIAEKQGWQPVDTLQRLEGFSDPWERAVYQGRELKLDAPLAEQGVAQDAVLTTVRRVLVADGWKIVTPGEEVSSDEDEW